MNNAPFLNKMKCVKKALCKEFNLPMTTSINKGFYCSVPNIEVGENTGLGNLYIRAIDKLRIAILGPAETKLIQIIQTQCKKVNYFINNHFNKL